MQVEMNHICKSFGANNVLTDISFSIKSGEVCALLGENGAGKSTLMNILGGVLEPDAGTIELDGKAVSFSSPVDSLDAGIGFVHQELNLVNDLTVYENMFLTHLKNKGAFLDVKYMQSEVKALFDRMNLDIDPNAMVRDLDASYKQIVEICRALLQNASIIIMDEPTTSLTEKEIECVFDMMRKLKRENVGIVFISHKLNEVMEICDTYSVLRDGKVVASGNVSDTNTREIAANMVGHEVIQDEHIPAEYGDEVLRVEDLSDGKNFKNVSFSVKAGEILGITGLLGDGRSELCQTIFGAMGGNYTGKVLLCGREIHHTQTYQAVESGIAYLPRNRKENSIIKDMSILDNGSIVVLHKIRKGPFIDFAKQEELFSKQSSKMRVKMDSAEDLITRLSGGNQQKVVLAKWLMSNPKVLILDNPTQGVDIGAKEEIYDIIQQLAKQGTAIMVLSSEAQEIIRVCDRSLIMYHGQVVSQVSGEDMTERNIMYFAAGGSLAQQEAASAANGAGGSLTTPEAASAANGAGGSLTTQDDASAANGAANSEEEQKE
ncbi:MAG: sugar ABC transporter ATP-binding protein [Lachnospiraceae bacterium]|nr:sugar ABC transporter ATP-binding protein [Lachnospiraceae bacterium]